MTRQVWGGRRPKAGRFTHLLLEDSGGSVTQGHLGPTSDTLIVHLDGDDRVERRGLGGHVCR